MSHQHYQDIDPSNPPKYEAIGALGMFGIYRVQGTWADIEQTVKGWRESNIPYTINLVPTQDPTPEESNNGR